MSAAPLWPHGGGRICVSLAEGSLEGLRARLDEVDGADLAEVRLDALDDPGALGRAELEALAEHSPVPLGFTLRPVWHGGGYRGSEADRRALLMGAASCGAAFIDIELDAAWADEALDQPPCPVIVSHHWDHPRPADLEDRIERMLELAPSLAKLVAIAEKPADALPLLRAGDRLAGAGQAAACFCMGDAGQASRLIAVGRGAGLIYAAVRTEHEVAPGQWSLWQLNDVLRLPAWQRPVEFCGLIGHPIGHSLSPAVFNAAFQERGTPFAYVPLAGEDLDSVLELAAAGGFRGLSVTMPFKEPMARRCVELDPLAAAIGAVNTVVDRDGGWAGYNTDAAALVEALAERIELDGAEVALIGAGGAARAAAVALARAGARLTVVNRTLSKAEDIAGAVKATAGEPEALERRTFDVVINATPVGMLGSRMHDDTPVASDWLRGSEVVFDMVYRPRRTRLLREAAAKGCTVVGGLEMFVRQAAAQYRLLTGDTGDAPLAVIRDAAERSLVDD